MHASQTHTHTQTDRQTNLQTVGLRCLAQLAILICFPAKAISVVHNAPLKPINSTVRSNGLRSNFHLTIARPSDDGHYIAVLSLSGRPDGRAATCQNYIRGLVVGWYFAHPPPKRYRGSKSAKFGHDFWPESPLTHSVFETEQQSEN